jgi:hypothetical protein
MTIVAHLLQAETFGSLRIMKLHVTLLSWINFGCQTA